MSTGSGAGMTAVTQGVTDILSVVTTMITTITSNAILTALLAAGFVTVALKLFKRMKRAVKQWLAISAQNMPMRFNRVGIIFQKGYDMKCHKMKKYFYIGLSAFMSLYLSLCSCIGSYASTESGSSADSMSAESWLERYWYAGSRWICHKYVVGSDAIFGTFADFLSWSVNEYGSGWMDNKTVVITQTLGEPVEYDVPDDVQEAVQEYVQYNISQNPLGYTECYLTGFDFLDTSVFSNYQTYVSVKYIIEHCNGYAFMFATGYGTSSSNNIGIVTIDRSKFDVNFIGSTLAGVFTNVGVEHNWGMFNQFPSNTEGVDFYCVRQQSGTYGTGKSYSQAAANAGYSTTWIPSFSQGVKNTASPYNSTNIMSVMTSRSDKELVYVFNTLNNYKNYNAGLPQPYYLTSEGMATDDWSANSGICNSGTMNNSGNYYSTVTNGVGTNWTPDQILALVDKVTSANGGSGGSSDSDKDTGKMWDRIGNAIGNLIDGIITVFTTIIEKLSDALLSIIHLLTGYTDDNGVVHEGLFTKLTSLVNSGFTTFISSIFSWLPDEIVTLLSATLVFGIFFGIFKMLRLFAKT